MRKQTTITIFFLFLTSLTYGDGLPFVDKSYFNSSHVKYTFSNNEITLSFDETGSFTDNSIIENIFTYPFDVFEDNKFTLISYNNEDYIMIYDENRILKYRAQSLQASDTRPKYVTISLSPISELWSLHNISASSFLTETIQGVEISYSGSNLENPDIALPWVEGTDGSGIGSYLIVNEGGWGIPNLIFVNGFFHPTKRYLYQYNNRIKKITLESTDDDQPYTIEIELDDTPNFQTFMLPRLTKNFKLTISDVYKGTKYDDTCLSGLFSDLSLGINAHK